MLIIFSFLFLEESCLIEQNYKSIIVESYVNLKVFEFAPNNVTQINLVKNRHSLPTPK